MKRLAIALCISLTLAFTPSANAVPPTLTVAPDREYGYNRSLFKHWINVLNDGCDTRKEVLIMEAVTDPIKTGNCTLVGGSWVDPYSGREITNPRQLDIDHLVPLAEVWRSGGYSWTPQEREFYANDVFDYRTLVAVSASLNRQKSDFDIANWRPPGGYMAGCEYVKEWIAVKLRFSLSVDPAENTYLQSQIKSCKITDIKVEVLKGFGNPAALKASIKKKVVKK